MVGLNPARALLPMRDQPAAYPKGLYKCTPKLVLTHFVHYKHLFLEHESRILHLFIHGLFQRFV